MVLTSNRCLFLMLLEITGGQIVWLGQGTLRTMNNTKSLELGSELVGWQYKLKYVLNFKPYVTNKNYICSLCNARENEIVYHFIDVTISGHFQHGLSKGDVVQIICFTTAYRFFFFLLRVLYCARNKIIILSYLKLFLEGPVQKIIFSSIIRWQM